MGDDFRRRGRGFVVLLALSALPLVIPPAVSAAPTTRDVAQALVSSLNDARAAKGLPALANSAALDAAAEAHALSMARRGYFTHASADGTPFWKRIAGFYPAGGFARWQVGETLYWSRPNPSPASMIAAWLGSPEHRTVLLGDWAQVGVAIVRVPAAPGVYGGGAVVIAVADFGLRRR